MKVVEFTFKFPNWLEKMKRSVNEINLFTAAQMQTNRGMLFDSNGSYNGRTPWAPLLFRQGNPLSDRGTLRKSIAPYNSNGKPGADGIVRISGETITIGTTLAYAGLMNWGTTKMPGGVLRPVNAKALRIPIPEGKNMSETGKYVRKQKMGRQYASMMEEADSMDKGKEKSAMYRKAKALNKRMDNPEKDKEKRFIFVKSVKIPERRFDTWNLEDENELTEALMNKVAEILERGS